MPTTQEEAASILKISQEYMPMSSMVELFTRLDDEVGQHSENDSLKVSLAMMKQLVSSVPIRKRRWYQRWIR